ncbi:hypothetical protein QZH41_008526 [Actinostola sp. cb2023]|nr:hypothetical protein QZH41_008526 [Actinostola sp. cb2023]
MKIGNREISLDKHSEYCGAHNSIKITLPKKGTTISFMNYNRSMRVPFVVYADFECFTEPINNSSEHAEDESYTEKYQMHRPSGFCYGIKSFDDLKPKIVRYTAKDADEDIGKLFVERLEKDIRKLAGIKAKDILMTEENRKDYDNAVDCFICNQKLKEDKVRDHDHLTGKYRGAAHAVCNLNYRIPKHIPVVFHNLAGYDAHLFIKSLGFSEGKIDCIPNNEEKYISFKKEIVVGTWIKDGKTMYIKRELRFIDSFKFMSSGLDKLVGNLKKEQFRNMSKFFTDEKLDLMLRKGVYPYDYVNSLSKLDETALPPKEEFFSKLNDIDISEADYKHAQKVWSVFKMKTMRDYHNLYLLSDVLLLMDTFEAFRDVCIKNYKLDPCWYYTAPGLSWDAMLKMTKIRLELLSDVDMLLMVEKGIRGGVSMITKRYAKANNKYMKEYRKGEKSIFIKYLDANNLYGWAMSEPLPTDGFKWMGQDKLRHWHRYPCILEVDLEYPEKLRDLHDEYPLAPEHLTLNKVEKLVPTTRNRRKYVVHHQTLKLYESLGMEITKIHRGITFNESDWLQKYINLNTELRTAAKNDFEKDFFKLMNNSVFGKTMENIRNRQDIKLVTTEKQAAKLISQPNYYRRTIFSEHLCAIHMIKTELVFNKPVYLGMAILDLSKALMYDFHYNYFKKKFRNTSALLFTDTDSLMYEVETEDFYKDIKDDIDSRFDTSAYPKDHPIGTWANKKVIGMMKDETAAEGEITEFVGLRSKLYAHKIEDKEEKKCKGIKKSVVKKDLEFDDYKNCLFSGVKVMRKMNVIRSYKHQLFSETVNKVALSREDDKRNILADQIHTHSI